MTRIAGADPTDTTFEILTDRLRREILCLLDKEGNALTDDEIAEILAATYDAPKQDIAIALRHVHLPKLKQVGFIDYDDRNGQLHYQGSELVELLLENGFMECKTCGDDLESGES